ncbi:MAG: class I SAM-dependent methyltransferase [Bacteroidota bacterium]
MDMEKHTPAIPAKYNRMFYEQQARRTIDPTTRLMMRYRFLMMRKHIPRSANDILEIGPGDGEFSRLFGGLLGCEGFHYTAVDIAAERLASWGNRNRSDINKVAVDVTRGFPFADNAFDVVLCGEVIEHLPNYREVLQDIYRILKPAGS